MSDITNSTDQQDTKRHSKWWWLLVSLPVLVVLITWTLNYMLVDQPVQTRLKEDPRNSVYSLQARYDYYIDFSTLILDLNSVEGGVAPVDLFRGLFQSAEALHKSGRTFDKVVLARSGTPVFLMKGDEFSTIGAEFEAGQNPVYLIRTLPEKLFRPNGVEAFGRWEGGLIGVLGKQMEDANEAAKLWAANQ